MKNRRSLCEFAKYASLNVLGMIGLSCYILADTFFVAKGLGPDGLTALNLAIPIFSFVSGSGLMFGMGGAIKFSILKDQKETVKANQVFTNTIMFSMLLAMMFIVIGIMFSEELARMLGAEDAVFTMSKTYHQVILLFAPMFILNQVLLCFVRNDGAPQLSMTAMIVGSLSNIVLDYIFIFPFHMGIFGAVFATGLAPIISMLVLSAHFMKKSRGFHLIKCKFSLRYLGNILSGGLPSLVTEVSSGIVMIVFNIIILGLQGNIGVAAYGVIANLSLVVIAIDNGIAQGIQPLISRYYGSGNHAECKRMLHYALVLLAVVSAVIYTFVYFGAYQIVALFNEQHDLMLETIAVTGLKIYFTGCVFAGFNIILCVYFTSTEKALPAHIISLLRGIIIVVPMAFLLSWIGGMIGVWCVFPITEIVVCMLGVVLFHNSKKKNAMIANPC